MQTLTTDDLARRLDQDDQTQLVAVYSSRYFETMHLPGSVNIPLKALPDRAEEKLDPERPVIVYCSSPQCDMSSQAADLLVDLGFETVCDYEGGVAEWLRSGRDVVRPQEDSDRGAGQSRP